MSASHVYQRPSTSTSSFPQETQLVIPFAPQGAVHKPLLSHIKSSSFKSKQNLQTKNITKSSHPQTIYCILQKEELRMLFTACILRHKPHNFGGIRLSIMSRHTLNDGVTPDPRIKPSLYDFHVANLAPSPNLLGDYYKRGLPWEDFEIQYKKELRVPDKWCVVQGLARLALVTNVTLLCIEEKADHCHRRLLAEACKEHESRLKIEHL